MTMSDTDSGLLGKVEELNWSSASDGATKGARQAFRVFYHGFVLTALLSLTVLHFGTGQQAATEMFTTLMNALTVFCLATFLFHTVTPLLTPEPEWRTH